MSAFLRENKLLAILVAVFFVKQLLLAAVFPMFQGPDEPAHYSTVQYYAESKDIKSKQIENNQTEGFNFSEELSKTSELIETDKIAFHSSNTQFFTNTSEGKYEQEIKNGNWKKYIENVNPSVVTGVPGYYFIPSLIEKFLSKDDIFARFFAIRIFSVILGTLIIILTFLSLRKIGLTDKLSFLVSALVAFQPMFSQASAIINYDIMLIFTFALFIYGAAWALKDGLNWKNFSVMAISIIFGTLTKAPAVALIPVFAVLIIYFIFKSRRYFLFAGLIISVLLVSAIFIRTIPRNYINSALSISQNSKFGSVSQSISKYISVTKSRWRVSEASYWGNFGWLDAKIPYWIIRSANFIEIIGIIGLILYFISPARFIPEFLPRRKFAIFLIGIFLALQFAVRFADWAYFNSMGKIVLGTPGRYFLPVIGAQFLLVLIGLGMLVRKNNIWENVIKLLAIAMIIFWLYSLLIIIIPRYYL